jgi:hypothetical protein
MYASELVYFIVFAVIILIAPYLPTTMLLMLDNIVVRIGTVIFLLFLISIGPTATIFGFMMMGVLYLERNRRKVGAALLKLDAMDVHRPAQATVEEASRPQTTVPVMPFDAPEERESDFLPQARSTQEFEPVAESINEKSVLASIYPLNTSSYASDAAHLYEKLGVGHLDAVDTMGNSLA